MKKKQISLIVLVLVAILIMPVLYGCQENTQAEVPVFGVLEGKASIGPRLPEEIGQPYAAEVYQMRKVMVYDADHVELLKQIDLDENGCYSVELIPGDYTIDINYYGTDTSDTVPRKLKIEPGRNVMLDINIDTGAPAESRLIGEHFYYGQDCIWEDMLVVLEYEYVEGKVAGQYLTIFNLNSHEKTRVLEIPKTA
jgi:hypothetical protein